MIKWNIIQPCFENTFEDMLEYLRKKGIGVYTCYICEAHTVKTEISGITEQGIICSKPQCMKDSTNPDPTISIPTLQEKEATAT